VVLEAAHKYPVAEEMGYDRPDYDDEEPEDYEP
jgi:hypothetical protein